MFLLKRERLLTLQKRDKLTILLIEYKWGVKMKDIIKRDISDYYDGVWYVG